MWRGYILPCGGTHPHALERLEPDMFALLALLCFLVALFGGHIGSIDLVVLGLAFVAAALFLGPYPFGGFVERLGRRS